MGSELVSKTFASLTNRNYRLYFIGQAISQSGTWMQSIAQAWLVLELGGTGKQLGLIMATQFLPVLLFGPYGGVMADRFPKRNLLYITQATAGALAVLLGVLVASHLARLWMLFPFAIGLGFVSVVDNPARQTFILEMVGPEQLANALTLNSTLMNLARVIGPAIGALLIAWIGLAWCFICNGISYVAVLVALALMQEQHLQPSPRSRRARGQLVEGFRYMRSNPVLASMLMMMAIVGTLTYNFSTTLPLFAKFTLHGDARTLGLLNSSMGIGAVFGGLFSATHLRGGPKTVAAASLLFGLFVLGVACVPNLWMAMVGMSLIGVASIIFSSLGNVTLQLESSPEMRGRVMALWGVAFLGTTPFGAPLIGWVGATVGPRWAIAIGGFAALAAAALGFATHRLMVPLSQEQSSIGESSLKHREHADSNL